MATPGVNGAEKNNPLLERGANNGNNKTNTNLSFQLSHVFQTLPLFYNILILSTHF